MKLKALIVDDERLARKELRSMLDVFEEISVIGEASNLTDAAGLITSEKPEVVFLDIQLSSETGFDLLERVEKTFKIIFVTAFDEYAIRAFEVNALDYLLKPVNPLRLAKAIDKLTKDRAPNSNQLRKLEYDDRLFIEIGERSKFLSVSLISHICASGDYSEIFTSGGEKFLLEKPLREWEERLPEKHFARIHRSTIVNLNEIDGIDTSFNRTLNIRLKHATDVLPVSRRYAAKLKEKFT